MRPVALAAGMLILGLGSAAGLANQINTGGTTGAYHSTFCPQLESQLKKAKFDYSCTSSEGSRENIQRVIGDPTQVGFSQLDVFALENSIYGGDDLFKVVRNDLGRECLFFISRNPEFTSFGDIAAYSDQIRFILPPAKSGVTGTFEFLQQIDPDGLGRARNITYAESADEAIDLALGSEDTVTLLVQFPDPKNARFKSIQEQQGNIVPVIDRNILRQEIGGQKVYYAEETEISMPKWNKSAEKVVTSCTPMVLFTGTPSRVDEGNMRKDQEDLIKTIEALKAEDLQPKQGFFSKLWQKTKALSAASVEKMVDVSEKAREKAKPTIDKAMERAKEMRDQAAESAKELYDEVKKKAGSEGSSDP
ncbi:MAG: hypothetical protein R3D57_11835 [Hyphomicrobiaceae bacterium]